MAKKSTKQGIGYINNKNEFEALVNAVANIITQEFNRSSDNATAINNIKSRIDNFVGRTRQSVTKTDIYQIAFLIFKPIVAVIQENAGRTFKETQVNTLVAKLMTEGEYGNPSVVRRQTTSAKLNELKRRLYPDAETLVQVAVGILTAAQQIALLDVAKRMLVRGTRSTTTTRISNRTRRTTPPRATPSRSTPPATPSQATPSQVTQTSVVNLSFVTDLNSPGQLGVGIRESIQKFKQTNDKRIKFGLITDAWRYSILLNIVGVDEGRVVVSDNFINATRNLITRIGDVYNPSNDRNYSEALKYLGYVLYIAASGKIRTAENINRLVLRNETRQSISRKIFDIGIGETAIDIFTWFAGIIGSREIYSIVANVMTPGNITGRRRFTISQLKNALSTVRRPTTRVAPTATVTEINVPGYSPEIQQTQAISTSRLEANARPSQTEVRATPDTSITELVKDAKFKNTLGIEIEYQEVSFGEMKEGLKKAKIDVWPRYLSYHESCNYDKYKQWRIMHDGSLKNRFGKKYEKTIYNSRGTNEKDILFGEVVSPILVGERGLLQLIRVLNTMTKLGATNNQSTGIHIHLGIKDQNQPFGISYQGLRNFIVNYIGFEKIIDSYVRKSRRQNNHNDYTPSPVVDIWRNKDLGDGKIADVTYSELEELSRKLNAFSDLEFRQWAVNNLKRGKLNPHSNALKFSFEIRQHGGTIERDTLMAWILFMHYLCVFSEKKISTRFTWKNLRDNILPKPLASFWENRINDLSGEARDWNVYDGWRNIPDIFDGPVKR